MSNFLGEFSPVNQTAEKEKISERLAKAQAQIIDSVLTGGIKSGFQLEQEGVKSFGSGDNESNGRPYWAVYSPFQTDEFDSREQIRLGRALYYHGMSVLPVMAERQWEVSAPLGNDFFPLSKEQQAALERRMQSTALIIFKNQEEYEKGRVLSKTGRVIVDTIKPADFLALILPEEIYSSYKENSALGNIDIPIEPTGLIQRSVAVRKDLFSVPDYETPVKKYAGDKQIALSGIRLPSDIYDLEFLKTGKISHPLFR